MDITQIYAITMAGFLFILLLARVLFHRIRILYKLWLLLMKVLFYSNLVSRHRLLGPWRNIDVTTQLIYIAINAFCFSFRLASTPQAGLRAARLSLINMILLFLGPHFSFLADYLGVTLRTYKYMHRSSGIMSSAFIVLHTLISIANKAPFPLDDQENLYAVIVSFISHSALVS